MLSRLFALFLLIFFSPIFILVSLAILIEDGFPVFFSQKRVGINYTFFNIYKFRSMKKNTPNVATHLLENPDQYLLKIGKFIKKVLPSTIDTQIEEFVNELKAVQDNLKEKIDIHTIDEDDDGNLLSSHFEEDVIGDSDNIDDNDII